MTSVNGALSTGTGIIEKEGLVDSVANLRKIKSKNATMLATAVLIEKERKRQV